LTSQTNSLVTGKLGTVLSCCRKNVCRVWKKCFQVISRRRGTPAAATPGHL